MRNKACGQHLATSFLQRVLRILLARIHGGWDRRLRAGRSATAGELALIRGNFDLGFPAYLDRSIHMQDP